MVRKIENARERFGTAAIGLFRERGYANTTVLQIAEAAGLTERTFYRYFIDKPEVLFWRGSELQCEIVEAIDRSEETRPLCLVILALASAGRFFDKSRPDVLVRQAIVSADSILLEREHTKMRLLAKAVASKLMDRAFPSVTARMTAEVGLLIWRDAIERWCQDGSRDFPHHVRMSHLDLAAVMVDAPASSK